MLKRPTRKQVSPDVPSAEDATDIAARLAGLRGSWEPTDYSERLAVAEERILVISDVHIPYYDDVLLADAFARAKARGVEAIVWLGDLLDHPMFSPWGPDDLTTNWPRELDIAEGVIREAAGIVKRQYWSSGNHEERWFRRLGNQGGMLHLARSTGVDDLIKSGHLIVSDNPALSYHHDTWVLVHPADYSGTPLVVPGKFADEKYHRNIVAGHAHHWAQGKSPSGRYTVIESGGAFKRDHIKYSNYRVTRHRTWVQGYVILDRGQATLYEGA